MRFLAVLVAGLTALTACSSDPDAAATPTPTPASASAPANNLTVSDAVPSLDDLRELGLGDEAAQCFIDTIDPEGTGKVQSAEAFMEAWVACL